MKTKKIFFSTLAIVLMLSLLSFSLIMPDAQSSASAEGNPSEDIMNQTIQQYGLGIVLRILFGEGGAKIDGVKDIYNDRGKLIEKWQLFRTSKLTAIAYPIVSSEVTKEFLVKAGGGCSFGLKAANSEGESAFRGTYYNTGAGLGWDLPVSSFEITAQYSKEMTMKTSKEYARSVSFEVSGVTVPGVWALEQVIEGYSYLLLRFTNQPVYEERDVYDSKGNYTGTEKYVSYWAWQLKEVVTFNTNVNEYFRLRKID
jgi:hypothetical protein